MPTRTATGTAAPPRSTHARRWSAASALAAGRGPPELIAPRVAPSGLKRSAALGSRTTSSRVA